MYTQNWLFFNVFVCQLVQRHG